MKVFGKLFLVIFIVLTLFWYITKDAGVFIKNQFEPFYFHFDTEFSSIRTQEGVAYSEYTYDQGFKSVLVGAGDEFESGTLFFDGGLLIIEVSLFEKFLGFSDYCLISAKFRGEKVLVLKTSAEYAGAEFGGKVNYKCNFDK